MKYLAIIGLVLTLASCGDDARPPAAASLADFRGQWLVVNYWAQWCKPCIEEIPELNELDDRHADIAVLGVNFEGATGEELAEQERSLGVAFPTLPADPSADLGVPRPLVLPTTLLVDPDGRVVSQLVGPQTVKSLERALEEARGQGATAVPGSGGEA